MNLRPLGPQPRTRLPYVSRRVPCVLSVPGSGRMGHIGRCIRYQSGTRPDYLAHRRRPGITSSSRGIGEPHRETWAVMVRCSVCPAASTTVTVTRIRPVRRSLSPRSTAPRKRTRIGAVDPPASLPATLTCPEKVRRPTLIKPPPALTRQGVPQKTRPTTSR